MQLQIFAKEEFLLAINDESSMATNNIMHVGLVLLYNKVAKNISHCYSCINHKIMVP